MAVTDAEINAEILMQISEKPSVAPRDIATRLAADGEDWRKYLPRIRQLATALHKDDQLNFIRKKKIVSPIGLKGVFRLAKPLSQAPEENVTPRDTDLGNGE